MSGSVDTQQLATARVYSQALLDLAAEHRLVDEVLEELEELAQLVKRDARLEEFLTTPLVDDQTRELALEKIFRNRLSDLLVNTLQVMNRKGRLGLVGGLAAAYRLEYEEREGRVDVWVTTAIPLKASLREQLRKAATELTSREAQLVETVDESILGGMIVQIGDRKIDTSVAREIHNFREQLFDRASQEIQSDRDFVSA